MTDNTVPLPRDKGRSKKPATEASSVEFGSPFGKRGKPSRAPSGRKNTISETRAKLGDLPGGATLTYEVDDDGNEHLVSMIVDGTWTLADPEGRVSVHSVASMGPKEGPCNGKRFARAVDYQSVGAKKTPRPR